MYNILTDRRQRLHGTDKVAPDAAHLAHRSPLVFGTTIIIPATREVRGPGGVAPVQPRVMLVLVALADARGAVVTRDDLARICWGRRFVAEDSLSGAIAELRKALRAVSAEGLSVETVPKTGYRLVAPGFDETFGYPDAESGSVKRGLDRRMVMGAGIATFAVIGFAGWKVASRSDREVALLVERGAQALRQGLPDADAQGVQFLSRAVELEPSNAKAWGMLALAWRVAAEYGGPDDTAKARANSETAAMRALAHDPRQSDALTALATLTPMFGHWIETEQKLRDVLAIDPGNRFAVSALGTLLMSTGQVRECWKHLDWLDDRDPLSPNLQFRRIYTSWSLGRLSEMDLVADRALQTWPRHPAVWFARFWTLAFTGRPAQAQAMLGDVAVRPPMPPPAKRVLQLSLTALRSKSAADIEEAVSANLAAASRGPGQATTALMVLSHLGATAAAFEVANGLLVRHGSVVVQLRHTPAQVSITDQHHRMTMVLWVPATRSLRLAPEFRSLCANIGLVDYWKARRTRPDFNEGSLATI